MKITEPEVRHVAALANLNLSGEEVRRLRDDLDEILAHMDKLNELDTTNVEPLSHVIGLSNVMRQDVVVPSYPRDEMLRNAPKKTDKFFKVPKVIGER